MLSFNNPSGSKTAAWLFAAVLIIEAILAVAIALLRTPG